MHNVSLWCCVVPLHVVKMSIGLCGFSFSLAVAPIWPGLYKNKSVVTVIVKLILWGTEHVRVCTVYALDSWQSKLYGLKGQQTTHPGCFHTSKMSDSELHGDKNKTKLNNKNVAYVCVDVCMYVWCMCVYVRSMERVLICGQLSVHTPLVRVRFSLLNFNIYTLNIYKTHASVIQSGWTEGERRQRFKTTCF